MLKNLNGIDDPYEEPGRPDLKVETGRDTVEQCVQQVVDLIVSANIIEDTTVKRFSPCLVQPISIDEAVEVSDLATLELTDLQAQTLQLISDGWAYPLNRFMNALELSEVLTNRTLTNEAGLQEPMSVPLVLDVDAV